MHQFVLSLTHLLLIGIWHHPWGRVADGRRKFGVRCWDGRAVLLPKPPKAPIGQLLVDAKMPRGEPIERAVASRVEVTVDMFRRALYFSIDGGLAVDFGILPEGCPRRLCRGHASLQGRCRGHLRPSPPHRHRHSAHASCQGTRAEDDLDKEFMEDSVDVGEWVGNTTPFGHASTLSFG